jgi:hypothetical protein
MARERLNGTLRVIDPAILALDSAEAVQLADAYNVEAPAALAMHADCAGWLAGVILEARAQSSVVERDSLSAFIASEVLQELSPSLRFALACTAELEWVSERLLNELAENRAVADELLRVPLPGALRRRGIQLAPCVRRVLAAGVDRLAARRASAQAAWRLRSEGAAADAADALIAAGHLLAAEAPAALAAAQGADPDRVLRWLELLDSGAARRRPSLRESQLRALHGRRTRASMARIARAMRSDGELDSLVARGEPAAAWPVASLVREGHAGDVLALIDRSEDPIWAPAAWALTVLCKPDPTPPPPDVGAVATLPLALVVAEALVWRGRPADAAILLELAVHHDPAIACEHARLLLILGDLEGARRVSTGGDADFFPARRCGSRSMTPVRVCESSI